MSSLKFSKLLAYRYLWSKRAEAFITIITVIAILGVAIGVMVLNITMSIMSGFEDVLQKKIVGTSHVLVSQLGGKVNNWQTAEQAIKTISDVTDVSAYVQSQALITSNRRSQGILIRGLPETGAYFSEVQKYLQSDIKVAEAFQGGVASDPNGITAELPGVIVGEELLKKLNLGVGDAVSLLSAQVGTSPFGLMPKYKRFKIAASYNSGLSSYDENIVYMSLLNAQTFFKLGDTVSAFSVSLKDPNSAPIKAKEIAIKLADLDRRFFSQDWTKQNKELWEAMKLEKNVYFIVLLLLIVMASFSIVTSLVMIVMEKRKDIAILRTLGAKQADIANIFRIQGATIGFLGTSIGTILGLVACIALREYGFPLPENVFPTSTVPVLMNFTNFFIVAISAFLICCIATVYPAKRAAQMKPSIVLRYE